ncbi:hypothetical protein C8J57DRAFT_324289 [Mycena rebaudengoi]|nr:hypothetical protein C8J57DRAFT_324289 [Mycena rebaudengoi]
MLRASWALISLQYISGARSRFDKPLPAFFSSSLRLWQHQDRSFASNPRVLDLKHLSSTQTSTPEVTQVIILLFPRLDQTPSPLISLRPFAFRLFLWPLES